MLRFRDATLVALALAAVGCARGSRGDEPAPPRPSAVAPRDTADVSPTPEASRDASPSASLVPPPSATPVAYEAPPPRPSASARAASSAPEPAPSASTTKRPAPPCDVACTKLTDDTGRTTWVGSPGGKGLPCCKH